MYRQFHEVRDEFYKEHGDYVVTPQGPVLFKDGAVDENSWGGKGPLLDPPTDDWERSKLLVLYWEIKAEKLKEAFDDYKSYLMGTGKAPQEAEGFYREQQHLDLLARFRKRAQTAKRMLRSARAAMDDSEPAQFKKLRRLDADQQGSKQAFKDKVERVRL